MNRPCVGDLARAVDRDEPSRLTVSASIEGQDGVALPNEAGRLDERVDLLLVPGDTVQEDERGPATRGRGAVGEVQRGRDRDAVVHGDGHVLLGESRAGGVPDEQDESGREGQSPGLRHSGKG